MSELINSFLQEIARNKSAETAPDLTSEIKTDRSSLGIRHRGCFITHCELTSARLGNRVDVLYSGSDFNVPKLTASHAMSPVGPSEGIGGQHGFPRWADYHEFAQNDGQNGEKRIAFQAMRSDNGVGLAKVFELTDTTLSSDILVYNPEATPTQLSLGEHYYFALAGENPEGLKVNGKTLDELFGENAEKSVMEGMSLFWPSFDEAVDIDFPVGHSIRLSTAFADNAHIGVGMLVWHKPGSPSICFEPTVGFDITSGNDGIELAAYSNATFSSKIELL